MCPFTDVPGDRLKECLVKVHPIHPISLNFPPPSLCTGNYSVPSNCEPCKLNLPSDNAVMIAWASMHRFLARDYDDYTINLRSKWNIDELSSTN